MIKKGSDRMQLAGKAALVTGGTHGIGAATAIALAERGADVALAARKSGDPEAIETRDRILALGRRCVLISADLAEPADATRSVVETIAQLGALDVLVHS